MTTIVVTNNSVMVDSCHTWSSSNCVDSKVQSYRKLIYTAAGDTGAGQIKLYRFIDQLLDESRPWPEITADDSLNASYVIVITSNIAHRDLGKGDVLCLDMATGVTSHDRYNNEFDFDFSIVGKQPKPVTVYTAGSGGVLYQTFVAINPDPRAAFEYSIETDPYSGFPYHEISRDDCRVIQVDRLDTEPRGFGQVLRTIAGKSILS